MTATRIDVTPSDGGPAYQVIVGVGILGELPGLVPQGARTVVVIHAEGLGEIARPACGALRAAGLTVHAEPVPDGEAAKTADVAAGLWSKLARHGVTRSDCVVGIGGGAATITRRHRTMPRSVCTSAWSDRCTIRRAGAARATPCSVLWRWLVRRSPTRNTAAKPEIST